MVATIFEVEAGDIGLSIQVLGGQPLDLQDAMFTAGHVGYKLHHHILALRISLADDRVARIGIKL